jgi:hypothetical protein
MQKRSVNLLNLAMPFAHEWREVNGISLRQHGRDVEHRADVDRAVVHC